MASNLVPESDIQWDRAVFKLVVCFAPATERALVGCAEFCDGFYALPLNTQRMLLSGIKSVIDDAWQNGAAQNLAKEIDHW